MLHPRLLIALLLVALPALSFAEGNPVRGRRLFQSQCAACHAASAQHRITGPGLAGIVGSPAAQREGFTYSDALKNAGLTWDVATLDRYLTDPPQYIPGTTMTQPVPAANARADIIAYLATLTPPAPSPAPAP
jgi:Cytochrome c2